MAEVETKNQPKDLVEPTPEELDKEQHEHKKLAPENKEDEETLEEAEPVLSREEAISEAEIEGLSLDEKRAAREAKEAAEHLASWVPKTQLGKDVKSGKETNLDVVLKERKRILEPEIVDYLIKPRNDLILIGQAKGKFGGGKRRAWRQTQKKTKEGNILTFSAMAVIGDGQGHVGVGYGRAKETLPAREKAVRNAKLNVIKIRRGFENPEDKHNEAYKHDPHTIPYVIHGKCGSVRVRLLPAPRGTGLVVGDELKKILTLAGVRDVYGKTRGHFRTTFNLAKACIDALQKTTQLHMPGDAVAPIAHRRKHTEESR